MTQKEFYALSRGDICMIKRGSDQGMKVRVIYIEDDSVLVKTLGEANFKNGKRLKLTSWKELDVRGTRN